MFSLRKNTIFSVSYGFEIEKSCSFMLIASFHSYTHDKIPQPIRVRSHHIILSTVAFCSISVLSFTILKQAVACYEFISGSRNSE